MFGVLGIVREGHEEIAFLQPDRARLSGLAGFDILDPARGETLVRRIAAWDATRLRAVLERGGLTPAWNGSASSMQDEHAFEDLAALVRAGRLLVARRDIASGLVPATTVAEELTDIAQDTVPLEPEPVPVVTFAAFRLVDDRGAPIASHGFKLDLPDGRTVEGVTAPDGRFEVDPVATPGNCVLRFEELP